MIKERRDHLRGVVARARRLVETTIQQQLNGFGLFTDAPPLERDELQLTPAREADYRRLLDAIRREARAMGEGDAVTPGAVERYVREAGGTWINRLAALRTLEAQGLLRPAATLLADEYGGLTPRAHQLREREASLNADEALRRGVEDAFRELSESVRVLFDLTDEQSLIWPDKVALRELLRVLSTEVSEDDWRQPDVLGWVYQYYNAEANQALKKRKNRSAGFKYRPDDIPIANQFYTPNWVVRSLADNTLGRLWLESRGRLPRLVSDGGGGVGQPRWRLDERRVGVPNASEAAAEFKAWIAEDPAPLHDLTVDRLCRFLVPLPSEAPPRPERSVRSIRVLDPACGSGHFLLYAFDLLFAMYREAEPELDPREIPGLILENNLFGIDIDLRAAQLAAFALYLKARSIVHAVDSAAAFRPRRVNIVVADAHIGSDARKEAFLERYREEPEVQALYRKIFSDVDNTNVLGSLLKVRPLFEELFGRMTDAQRKRAIAHRREWIGSGQQELIAGSPQRQLREVFRASSGREFRIDEMLDELRRFEREVLPAQDIGALLFYTDLERTVGLIGLLSQRYDVVLMNPPYGDMPPEAKDYLKGNPKRKIPAHYPRTHSDYATAFLEQAINLLDENGFVGMLVSRSFMHLTSFEEVRTQLLLQESRPELVLDLGRGILDRADVRVCASVVRAVRGDHSASSVVFDRLAYYRDAQRPVRFRETLPGFVGGGPDAENDWFIARLGSLRDVPGMPYAYWASDWLRALFRRHPPLDRDQRNVLFGDRPGVKLADVKQGLATADDPRFLRFHWEVPRSAIGQERRWIPFVKGGSEVRFFARTDLVVNWDQDGKEQKEFGKGRYQGQDFYFKPGITWPRANWRIRRFGLFPRGCIFADKGPSIFPSTTRPEIVLAVLNSSLGTATMLLQTPERMWEVGHVGNAPVSLEALSGPVSSALESCVAPLVLLRRSMHEGDETFCDFSGPDLRRLFLEGRKEDVPLDLTRLLAAWSERGQQLAASEVLLLDALDDTVHGVYETPAEDRILIARELARRPNAEGGYSGEETEGADDDSSDTEEPGGETANGRDGVEEEVASSPVIEQRDVVARWISYYVKQIVESDDDGIVPLMATRSEPGLIVRVRQAMAGDLGSSAAQALEAQAATYLGTPDLDEWLCVSREETLTVDGKKKKLPVGFLPWHVECYRSRPRFWVLSSENFESGPTRVTFRVLLHYLRVTNDTLSRIVSYYLEPLATWANSEWDRARLEVARSEAEEHSRAEAKAQEWSNTVGALGQFRSALERVIEGPQRSEAVPRNARWLQRTIAAVRGGRDLGHGYRPDIDLGVRVNITPLVEERLLPRVVLARLGG